MSPFSFDKGKRFTPSVTSQARLAILLQKYSLVLRRWSFLGTIRISDLSSVGHDPANRGFLRKFHGHGNDGNRQSVFRAAQYIPISNTKSGFGLQYQNGGVPSIPEEKKEKEKEWMSMRNLGLYSLIKRARQWLQIFPPANAYLQQVLAWCSRI
jgi:hypothetical protein